MECICKYNGIDIKKTGKKISKLMSKNGYTVSKLANTLGVSSQAVYKWINGQSLPTLDNVFQISHLFATNMDDIIVGSGCYEYKLPDNYFREENRIKYCET